MMRRRIHFEGLDVVACLPLLSFIVLVGVGLLAYAQVGHWPHYNSPDPKQLALGGIHLGGIAFAAIFLGAIASLAGMGGVGYHLLLVAATAAAEWRPPQLNLRMFGRTALATTGFAAFWCQFGFMLNWLLD